MASTSGRWPAGRSRGVTVAVDGFFAFVMFGWGPAAAPSWLVIPLAVAGAASLLLAVAGVVMAFRSPGPLPAVSDAPQAHHPAERPVPPLIARRPPGGLAHPGQTSQPPG
jgi:hypothetical protein